MSTCETCVYFQDFLPNEEPIEGYKPCRRNPPNRIALPAWHEMMYEWRQDLTAANWWCGEYKK